MHELGLDAAHVATWFKVERIEPFVLALIPEEVVASWNEAIGPGLRRCYATDDLVAERSQATGLAKVDIVRAKLPDAGSTMAGDFGEIISYIYLAGEAFPQRAVGPKKWRLKQDRTKPAPLSDVLHFVLPDWPMPGTQDALLCAEVKTKSTRGESAPIQSAIDDCAKDRTGRLARTLAWLKERAIGEDLGAVTIDQLNRFIQAVDHPPCEKRFHAVAVICSTLLAEEIEAAPMQPSPEYRLIVISVPQLRDTYTSVYQSTISALEVSPDS